MNQFKQTDSKQQRWSLRKSTKGIASALLGFTILTSGLAPTVIQAASIHDHALTEIPSESSEAPAKYAVIAEFSDKTKQIMSGDGWFEKDNKEGNPYHTVVEPKDTLKGKLGVTYTHIGNYKGKDLDLKITVKDWKEAGFAGGEYFSFADNHIGFHQGGYDWVDLEFEYIYSDNGKPASDLTGTYMTVIDIDGNQGMGFSENQMKNIGKVYAPKESEVDVEKKKDGFTYFQDAQGLGNINPTDPRGHFTILVEDHTLNFRWAKDWFANSSEKYDKIIDWENGEYEQYFAYSAEKPVRTELLDPAKLTSDDDEKEVLENNLKVVYERYEYDITHTVSAEYTEFFYKEYIMEDQLNEVLDKPKVTVYNESDEDVTHLFENLSEGNLVKFKATSKALRNKDFYGHTYRFNVKTNIKEGADLSKVTDADGKVTVPNQATIYKDGKEQKNTETTLTHVPTPIDSSVSKAIIDENGEDTDMNNVSIGDQFQYRITGTFPNNHFAKTLGIYDDVPDALKVEALNVYDADNNDITDQGTLEIDNDNESFKWIAKNPKAFAGKTIYAIPTVSVKDTVNFSEYEEDGNYVFKNTAQLFVDDETLDSDEVKTVLEKVESEIKKGIVDGEELIEENEVSINDVFEYQVDTTFANESVPSILGVQDSVPEGFNLDSVVIIDTDGNDVTELGTLEIDDETETFKWTANDSVQFVGKTLTSKVQVTVKEDYNFTEFKNGEYFVFENTAQMITSDEDGNEVYEDSNTVLSKLKKIDNTIEKTIVDADGNEVDENTIKQGDTFTYKISQTVSNEENIDSIAFYDDLEDVLEVVDTNVYVLDASDVVDEESERAEDTEEVSETDRAEQETDDAVEEATEDTQEDSESTDEESAEDNITGTEKVESVEVDVKDKESIVSWNVDGNNNYLKGKTIVTEIEVELPKDADLKEYTVDEDNYVLPNVATGKVNENELESNEVNTYVPYEEEETPIVETPEEPKAPEQPETPKTPESPEPPQKDPSQVKTPPVEKTVEKKAGWLPHTGTEVNYAIIFGGISLLTAAGYALYRIRKSQS